VELALIERLRRIDMLLHERREALLEFGTALAWLKVHHLSFFAAWNCEGV